VSSSRTWQEHIDGLRAVAVLAVLFHHLDIHPFSGGFVGVDVFFVISGYLISRMIYDEIGRTGRFDILGFYERRARRILPAFAVVTVAVLITGYFLLLPDALARLGRSALYACLFGANMIFYQTTNYFAPAADTQPLLHTWSLGVEEQFYIVFPLVVAVIWRGGKRLLIAVLLASFIASFALAHHAVGSEPMAAFYLSPQRAWELLAGSLLALPGLPAAGRKVGETAALMGLALILFAIFRYGPLTPFPGASALVPVAGTALILWANDGRVTVTGRALSLPPFRAIGLWSYSIYMIHWPLIVFTKELFEPGDEVTRDASIIATSIGLGYLSYRFVEAPFRSGRLTWARPAVFGSAAAALITLGVAGNQIYNAKGYANLLPPDVRRVLAYNDYDFSPLYRLGVCFLRREQGWPDLDVETCLGSKAKTVLLWGDSHAAHYFAALRPLVERNGYTLSQATASLCAPLEGFSIARRPNCAGFNAGVFGWIARARPEIVILSAVWPTDPAGLAFLDATIDRLKSGGARVVIIGPGLRYDDPVPTMLAKRLMRGDANSRHPRPVRVEIADKIIRNHVRGKGVLYLSPLESLCAAADCPLADEAGTPLQWDKSHFTIAGAALATARMFTAGIFDGHAGEFGGRQSLGRGDQNLSETNAARFRNSE
jgi:peptidoglycan/LPS O-acetylase OafA/YrhL